MALEILRYTMCRVRQGRLVSLPLEVFKLVHILGWKGWTYFYRYVWRQVSPPYCNVFSSFQRENLPSTFSKGDFQKILFWPFLQSCKITTQLVYKGFIKWIAGRAKGRSGPLIPVRKTSLLFLNGYNELLYHFIDWKLPILQHPFVFHQINFRP